MRNDFKKIFFLLKVLIILSNKNIITINNFKYIKTILQFYHCRL